MNEVKIMIIMLEIFLIIWFFILDIHLDKLEKKINQIIKRDLTNKEK